jgi:hypothetical protein
MNKRIAMLSVLVMLVIAGLVAGIFTGSIRNALSAPIVQMMGGLGKPAVQPAAQPGKVQAGKVQATPGGATAKQPANAVNTLAQDTFQRQNQQLWGTATDGSVWGGDANKAKAFAIVNGVGQIANEQGAFNALLGQAGTNMEVMMSGSMNHFNNGNVNLGAVLRWGDANNWYKVFIDGAHLSLLKRVQGKTTTLARQAFAAQDGKVYALRFRAIGAMLFARAWLVGTAEPQNWQINITDNTLASGQAGVRVVLQVQSVVNITAFSVLPATLGATA